LALFGKKSKSVGPGVIHTEDEILGYLDDVFRQRGNITVYIKNKEWQCSLYFVDIKRRLLRIEDSTGLIDIKDKAVNCGFTIDGTWFIFQSKLVFSDGKPHVVIPKLIKHHDRRKNPRVNISPRENVRVSILQSLGAGIGITGLAINVNIEGICTKIERCINLQNEQPVSLRHDTLPRGTELMIVKVNRIPGVPSFEAPAIVKWLSPGAGGKIAVQFPKIPGAFKTAIENFVKSRYLPYRPVKRSYQRRQEIEREKEIERQKEEEQAAREKEVDNTSQKEEPILFVSDKEKQTKGEKKAKTPVTGAVSPDIKETRLPDIEGDPQMEPEPDKPQLPILVSLGEEIENSLKFLKELKDYEWIHAESPMRIIKFLRERKCEFLFLPPEYKQQSMLEYLEKMSGMGILDDLSIVLLSNEQLSPKDMIKIRMLGIEHTFILPLESESQILNIINGVNSDLQ